MFEAKLSEARIFKQSIEAISQLISECTVNLKKDGIELKAMDSANVSMVDFQLLSSAFDKYDLDKDQSIGVNMEDLTQVLKRSRPNDSLVLKLEDNRLQLLLAGTRRFVIPLLDIGEGVTKTPNLEFPTEVEIKTDVMEECISDAEVVSDAVVFEADKDKFTIIATGDGRKVEAVFDKDSADVIGLQSKGSSRSMFPLDYLKKIIKGAKISETTKIELGTDYPLRVTSGIKDKVRLRCVLAPRIESE